MNHLVFKVLFRSIGISTSISLIYTLILFLLGFNFCKSIFLYFAIFITSFLLQYIISFFIVNDREGFNNQLIDSLTNNLKNQEVPLTLRCSYCNLNNTANISYVKDTNFVCKGCNQLNKIIVQFSAVRTTETEVKNPFTKIIDETKIMDDEKETVLIPIEETIQITSERREASQT